MSVVETGAVLPDEGLSRDLAPETPERPQSIAGVLTGTLVGFRAEGRVPLVTYRGQPGFAALAARTVVDLQGGHIGREVVLMFDRGDPGLPIVIGCMRPPEGWPDDRGSPVEVELDGERLIVSAAGQLVLRCGKASITLTRAGKVLVEGTYVITRSSGVNRIKGGSVQIN
jgi:hypothetical protein